MARRKLNRDLMNNIAVGDAARDAMTVLDALQKMTPERQIIALTAVYRLMTERFGIEPQDIHTTADNIMNHAQGRRREFEAVADYMEGEL